MSPSLLSLKLIELRKKHNYTQEYVSAYLHMSRGGYSQYETGNRLPSYEALLKLTILYNINIDQLINTSLIPVSVSGSSFSDTSGEYMPADSLDINNLHHLGVMLLNSSPALHITDISQADINFLGDFKKLNQSDQDDIKLFITCKLKNRYKNNDTESTP